MSLSAAVIQDLNSDPVQLRLSVEQSVAAKRNGVRNFGLRIQNCCLLLVYLNMHLCYCARSWAPMVGFILAAELVGL